MTPRERELIVKVADDVRAADRSHVDADAERLIRAEVAAQPHAAYLLTRRVIFLELSARQARDRIDELEARLRQAGYAPGPAQPPPGAGAPAPAAGGGGGVGGFLRSAAAAAAGAVGGELLFDGLRHWAGGGEHHPGNPGHPDYGPDRGGDGGFPAERPGESEAVGGGNDWAEPEATGAGGDWADDGTNAGTDAAADAGSGGDWGDDGGTSDAPAGGGGDW